MRAMNALPEWPACLTPAAPAFSQSLADGFTPGVVVEAVAETAKAFGAFEETALHEAAAWEANADLSAD
jgi:type IV secretion system protein VirB1